jgi:hypothetical protein
LVYTPCHLSTPSHPKPIQTSNNPQPARPPR